MNEQPFYTAAKTWLENIEKKTKLNKKMRRAVMSFALWLDLMIRQQDKIEENKHDKEN